MEAESQFDQAAWDAMIASCGGLKKCGGENPYFRAVIYDVGVVWRDGRGQAHKATLVGGKFLRGDKAKAILQGE